MFQNKIKTDLLFKLNLLIFLLITFYIFSFTNLFFYSTYGADYQKYITYLEFFFGTVENTGSEQSPLYFFLVSFILNFRSKFISPTFLQSEISFAIQLTNLFILLIGLLGLYFLLKQFNISKNKIILVFHLLNIFPPMLSLRLTMKPEILVFALIPWFLYLINLFSKTKNINFLFIALIPSVLISSSKGSWLGIFLIFGFFIFISIFKKLNIKSIFLLILLFFIIFSVVTYENEQLNKFSVLDFQITENYNNSANLSIIYKNELGPRQSFNNFEFDVGTLLGITVLDTFSDHFNFFWDKDVSFFNQHRKEIIIENSSVNFFEIDTTNRNIKYNGPFKESLKNLRLIIGVCLTILFYIFILFFSVKQKKYRLYILSPFIGMLILLINALGFPTNNFDPFVADTFKTFYYSPFLILAFTFLLISLKKRSLFIQISFIVLYVFTMIFIYGFPKQDSSEYIADLDDRNIRSVMCETNKYLIFDLNNKSECLSKYDEFCKFQNSRVDEIITVEGTNKLDTSGFIIHRMFSEISSNKITDNSCFEKQKTSGLIDFSKIPKINILLLFSFFILILIQKNKNFRALLPSN
tara:strand:- start:273 stop:2018 length:1746 start_codon:yes stop_codon:yes gene_type:complete